MSLDIDEEIGDIYVERETSLLYEVKFFKDFVLTRPASPQFYTALSKMDHVEFANRFDEYYGNHEEVKDILRGMNPELVIERN